MRGQGVLDSIRPLVEAFSKVSNEDHRGTRLADEAHFPPNKPPKTVTLNTRVHQLLLQLVNDTSMDGHTAGTSRALELEKVSISGIVYASEKLLPRDSNIIFRRPGGTSHRVGRVRSIFQSGHQPGVTFLVVSQHKLIEDINSQNVYRRFGFAGGFLCDEEEDGRILVIRSEDVVCHFAKTLLNPREEKLMHVLPLNAVRGISKRWSWADRHAENARVPNPGGVLPPGTLSSIIYPHHVIYTWYSIVHTLPDVANERKTGCGLVGSRFALFGSVWQRSRLVGMSHRLKSRFTQSDSFSTFCLLGAPPVPQLPTVREDQEIIEK